MSLTENYKKICESLPQNVRLVAVSKYKSAEDILQVYGAGQRIFGENKAQEMKSKYEVLPKDIEWHFIGHLQTNKIKYIAPYVSLIQSIDSLGLLREVNKAALKCKRVIPCLLQFHIAQEETKFGLSRQEALQLVNSAEFKDMHNVSINGVMGMATNTDNEEQIRGEFSALRSHFEFFKPYFGAGFKEISMGMSDDYPIAVMEGSTLVRVGSAIFGPRDYSLS